MITPGFSGTYEVAHKGLKLTSLDSSISSVVALSSGFLPREAIVGPKGFYHKQQILKPSFTFISDLENNLFVHATGKKILSTNQLDAMTESMLLKLSNYYASERSIFFIYTDSKLNRDCLGIENKDGTFYEHDGILFQSSKHRPFFEMGEHITNKIGVPNLIYKLPAAELILPHKKLLTGKELLNLPSVITLDKLTAAEIAHL
jgi:hypothetical protein